MPANISLQESLGHWRITNGPHSGEEGTIVGGRAGYVQLQNRVGEVFNVRRTMMELLGGEPDKEVAPSSAPPTQPPDESSDEGGEADGAKGEEPATAPAAAPATTAPAAPAAAAAGAKGASSGSGGQNSEVAATPSALERSLWPLMQPPHLKQALAVGTLHPAPCTLHLKQAAAAGTTAPAATAAAIPAATDPAAGALARSSHTPSPAPCTLHPAPCPEGAAGGSSEVGDEAGAALVWAVEHLPSFTRTLTPCICLVDGRHPCLLLGWTTRHCARRASTDGSGAHYAVVGGYFCERPVQLIVERVELPWTLEPPATSGCRVQGAGWPAEPSAASPSAADDGSGPREVSRTALAAVRWADGTVTRERAVRLGASIPPAEAAEMQSEIPSEMPTEMQSEMQSEMPSGGEAAAAIEAAALEARQIEARVRAAAPANWWAAVGNVWRWEADNGPRPDECSPADSGAPATSEETGGQPSNGGGGLGGGGRTGGATSSSEMGRDGARWSEVERDGAPSSSEMVRARRRLLRDVDG